MPFPTAGEALGKQSVAVMKRSQPYKTGFTGVILSEVEVRLYMLCEKI